MVQAQGYGVSVDSKIPDTIITIGGLALLAGLGYLLWNYKDISKTISDAIPKIPEINLPFSQKTDLQTINTLLSENYNVKYAELSPAQKAEYQQNLGTTKAYYEEYKAPMTFEAFQAAVVDAADINAAVGGCQAGYHLSANGLGCIRDTTPVFTKTFDHGW